MDLQPQWTAKTSEKEERNKTRPEKNRSTWRQFKLEELHNENKNELRIKKGRREQQMCVCVYF